MARGLVVTLLAGFLLVSCSSAEERLAAELVHPERSIVADEYCGGNGCYGWYITVLVPVEDEEPTWERRGEPFLTARIPGTPYSGDASDAGAATIEFEGRDEDCIVQLRLATAAPGDDLRGRWGALWPGEADRAWKSGEYRLFKLDIACPPVSSRRWN